MVSSIDTHQSNITQMSKQVSHPKRPQTTTSSPRPSRIPILKSRPPPPPSKTTPLGLPSLDPKWEKFPRSHIVDHEDLELKHIHRVSERRYRPANYSSSHNTIDSGPSQFSTDAENNGNDDKESGVGREKKRDKLKTLTFKLVCRIRNFVTRTESVFRSGSGGMG